MRNTLLLFLALSSISVAVAQVHSGHPQIRSGVLPSMPADIPRWISSPGADHLFYKAAPYNWAIERIPAFAKDMYGTGVGHAMAYEALVTGQKQYLESRVFDRINRVLQNPPRVPVDEAALSPTFVRKFGYLEKVFDWAHILHFQTIDVLMHPGWSDVQKEAEIERLWKFYSAQPYAITGLPMNMEHLDSFPFSGRFRENYPKVNALFWGYHWLQTVNYDMLFGVPVQDQAPQYDVLGTQYRTTELYRIRDFMPMTAEMSPRFSMRFPMIANAFDNLHMLHDNVNDILAADELSERQKQEQVKIAIYRVLASTHAGHEPGSGEEVPGTLHDHRHPTSTPGMGYMKGMEDDVMFMSGMGWMDMSVCAHCSIPLPDGPMWGATVTADGWTMLVRCLMCARDMAAETPGRAIIRAATEDPTRTLVLISDEEGNLTSNIPGVVFLDEFAEHPECSTWSRAFTSKTAFDAFIKEYPELAQAKPLDLNAWAQINRGTPDTYRKIDRPNPYKPDLTNGGNR
jgi:hypothetical protein